MSWFAIGAPCANCPVVDVAGLLVDQAIAHLAGFGEEAALLRAIARFVVERDR